MRGAAFLLRDAMLAVERGQEVPAAPVCAHGDGATIEYDDDTPYVDNHPGDLTAGHAVVPQDPVAALAALEGHEFRYVYFEPTDKLGADKPNPKSHVCYGYATTCVILDKDRRVSEVYAAHDSGKVVNPIAIQGQIEGGVLMSMGYALTEDFRSRTASPGALWHPWVFLRANPDPPHRCHLRREGTPLPVALAARGIGRDLPPFPAPAIRTPITGSMVCFVPSFPLRGRHIPARRRLARRRKSPGNTRMQQFVCSTDGLIAFVGERR